MVILLVKGWLPPLAFHARLEYTLHVVSHNLRDSTLQPRSQLHPVILRNTVSGKKHTIRIRFPLHHIR